MTYDEGVTPCPECGLPHPLGTEFGVIAALRAENERLRALCGEHETAFDNLLSRHTTMRARVAELESIKPLLDAEKLAAANALLIESRGFATPHMWAARVEDHLAGQPAAPEAGGLLKSGPVVPIK